VNLKKKHYKISEYTINKY